MIGFYTKETSFNLKSRRALKRWIKQVIENHGGKCKDITVVLCSDPFLLDMNRQFLGHDYYTDIITFDYCEGKNISGELYISIDTVKANAIEYGEPFLTELHRVIIHGILHLLGFDDHTGKEIAGMRAAEDESLVMLEAYLLKESKKEHSQIKNN